MITGIYAGLIGLMAIYLSVDVIKYRRAHKIGMGDAQDAGLIGRMRAFGNLMEYAPLALILMGLAEVAGAWGWLLHLSGLALVIGRAMHAQAMRTPMKNPTHFKLRAPGMLLTFGVIVVMAIVNIMLGILG